MVGCHILLLGSAASLFTQASLTSFVFAVRDELLFLPCNKSCHFLSKKKSHNYSELNLRTGKTAAHRKRLTSLVACMLFHGEANCTFCSHPIQQAIDDCHER